MNNRGDSLIFETPLKRKPVFWILDPQAARLLEWLGLMFSEQSRPRPDGISGDGALHHRDGWSPYGDPPDAGRPL